ncbi:unnamed protein product [Closterium sp. Naga37s-1]|nr:unnamed protein product [Closterium sp. Naga37s-1]
MRYFHKSMNKFHCPHINLNELWSLVPADVKEKASGAGSAPVLDVTKFGFFKVLGAGELPSQPLIVKAKLFSKLAERRIKEAGGYNPFFCPPCFSRSTNALANYRDRFSDDEFDPESGGGERAGELGDWDDSRSSDDISMGITRGVSLGGIGSTMDEEDDWREETAASLQGYRYQYDNTGEQEENFHNMPGVSARDAGAGGEGEDFDEFQQGAGGQASTLAARGVDERGVSRADTQGHGKPVAEQYEDSDQVFTLEAAAVVDNKEPGRLDHDQMVRQRSESGGSEPALPAHIDTWSLQENPLNVSVE